jgi:hypothetical protein
MPYIAYCVNGIFGSKEATNSFAFMPKALLVISLIIELAGLYMREYK